MLPAPHLLREIWKQLLLFQEHLQYEGAKDLFDTLQFLVGDWWQRERVALPVTAGVREQAVDMGGPVGMTAEGPGDQHAAREDVAAAGGLVQEGGDRLPRAAAELRQKPPVVQEVQPLEKRYMIPPYSVHADGRGGSGAALAYTPPKYLMRTATPETTSSPQRHAGIRSTWPTLYPRSSRYRSGLLRLPDRDRLQEAYRAAEPGARRRCSAPVELGRPTSRRNCRPPVPR